MLRTARLTEALRHHGRTITVSAVAAAALAGAGSASAVLASGPTPMAGHAASPSAVSALTTAHPTASHKQSKQQGLTEGTSTVAFPVGNSKPIATTSTVAFPIGHPTMTVNNAVAAPDKPVAVVQHASTAAPAPAQQSAPAPQAAPAAQPAPAPAPQPAQPTTIYDSVTPSSIPAGAQAAVYSDGTYAASPAQMAGHPNTLWIDTNGSNIKANVLDVEPGDATPQQAATWVQQKLTANPNDTAIVYTFRAEWGPTQQAISALPQQMQSHVKWWIADPTGVPHIVPGSDATQWYWGQSYDQSLANPGF
jgi:hypothetical protein